MKRGNTVATVLLIAVMLAAAGILVQNQVFPAQTNFVERTISTFSQFVFEDPKGIVKEYSMNAYQSDDGYWYCGDYASPPEFEKVVGDFPSFSEDLLLGRLETVKQEFPGFDVEISEPNFAFTGVDGDVLVDTVVGVNVSNFTVTVRDGDRVIGMEYDNQYEYALRFWKNYQTMFEWITTGNGGIYSTVDEVLESRACAFVKNQCFCATDDPDDYTLAGDKVNPCPCFRHNPHYSEEDCPSGDPLKCQDFVTSERDQIMQEYGINRNDLVTIGSRIEEQLEQQFEENISCTAKVSEPFIQNSFVSAFVIHPSPCPREQLGGTCGIVPMNVFDTIMCTSGIAENCHFCPDVAGTSNTIGENAFNNDAMLQSCIDAATINADNCEFIEVRNEQTGEVEEMYACENGEGTWVVVGDNETDAFSSCRPENLLPGASQGGSGKFSEASQSLFPSMCNPLPEGANPGPNDVAQEMFERGKFSATSTVKELEDIPTFSDMGSVWWEGVNGWLDRRGAMDLTITCSDPGTETLDSFETEIDLRIVFRHGCDTSQNRVSVFTPEICGVAPDTSIPSCECPDDGNPCTSEQCVKDPETGEEECVRNNLDGNFVEDPTSQCQKIMCEDGVANPEITEPKAVGASCGTGSDAYCKQCDGAGSCVPKEDGTNCYGEAGICQTSSCQAGSCVAENTADASCGGGTCGECECTEDGPVYTKTPEACNSMDPRSEWVSCTEQQEYGYECVGTNFGRYDCQIEGSSNFDTSVCCPSPGPGSQVCTSGKICCGGDACTLPDACDAQ